MDHVDDIRKRREGQRNERWDRVSPPTWTEVDILLAEVDRLGERLIHAETVVRAARGEGKNSMQAWDDPHAALRAYGEVSP